MIGVEAGGRIGAAIGIALGKILGTVVGGTIGGALYSAVKSCKLAYDISSDLFTDIHHILEDNQSAKLIALPQDKPIKKIEPIAVVAPLSTPATRFAACLHAAKNRTHSTALLKLISPSDLDKMYDYVLEDTQIKNIAALKPGGAYRYDKHNTQLPRTCNVLCSKKNEYKLILETKSKLANGAKQSLPVIAGSYKSGKPAWRIDQTTDIEYFNLVSTLKNLTELDDIKKEVKISQMFDSERINEYDMGVLFNKKGAHKISLYSEKAKMSLADLLSSGIVLSTSQKNQLIEDLQQAVALFHQNNIAHQDIKPGNILVIEPTPGHYRLKLTDFGQSTSHRDLKESASATYGYQSPEIACYHASHQSSYYDYFNNYLAKNALGYQIYSKNSAEMNRNRVQYKDPHISNDLWAQGIVSYEILYGKKPSISDLPKIQAHPLLSRLLNTDRYQRFEEYHPKKKIGLAR